MTKASFIHRNFTNPNCKSRFSLEGVSKLMKCGQIAECIADNGCYNITVRFDDGAEVKTSRGSFRKGSVANPNLGVGESIRCLKDFSGITRVMNSGFKATIIDGHSFSDLTVEFDDGTRLGNVLKSDFDRLQLQHPLHDRIWSRRDSVMQRLLYYYIHLYFKDAKMNYSPDWLRSSLTGYHFELDIYIPSLRVAIEFDGSVVKHFTKTASSNEKYRQILNAPHIKTIYTIRPNDKRIVTYDSHKHVNMIINGAGNSEKLLRGLYGIIKDILFDLGKSFDSDFDSAIREGIFNKLQNWEDYRCLLGM